LATKKKSLQNREFTRRKKDHVSLSLKEENEARGGSGFDSVRLLHSALPEMDLSEVSISTSIFGKKLNTPFVVTGMTGGWEGSPEINERIARVCEKRGWLMGVGSQRKQMFDATAGKEWIKIREVCPSVILLGNIGLSQLIKMELSLVEDLVASLKASAMVVHTNPLQEALQPEGTPQFKGGLKALQKLCEQLSVPVIVKETGCGFSKKILKNLSGMGLFAVDISGYGGTHWGRIEGDRADNEKFPYGAAEAFKNWGISTVDSLLFAGEVSKDYEVWASGGIRSGCDAAKALALGADRVGIARSIIQAALRGEEVLEQTMSRLEYELKVALFCSGCRNIEEIKQNENVVEPSFI
jgi:isopentenyl-diphosphate delta-isomerase